MSKDETALKFMKKEDNKEVPTSSLKDFILSLPKVEFAPLNVPFIRRCQTFGACVYISIFFIWPVLFITMCFFPKLWPLLAIYIVSIIFNKSHINGSYKIQFLRELTIWKWLADYFPAKLIVEQELDPKKNYILGYHPHGVLGTGSFINFATEGTNISKILPGIDTYLCTLDSNFFIPFHREFYLTLGLISVSKKSILNTLKKGPGKAVVIVVGGAQESLSANHNNLDLILKKRYGFVSLAIKTGSDLVPVFSFGENHMFNTTIPEPDSFLHKFQHKFKSMFGFTIPLFHGRGPFTYNYGLMPKRVPLNVVIGKPISIKQESNPTPEKIQEIHQQYMDAVKELYDKYKGQYSPIDNPPEIQFI